MRPWAILSKFDTDSEVVKIESNTSPLSFPTLVHHDTKLAEAPCSLRVIFFVESILRIVP
jgi:hypothetical protein